MVLGSVASAEPGAFDGGAGRGCVLLGGVFECLQEFASGGVVEQLGVGALGDRGGGVAEQFGDDLEAPTCKAETARRTEAEESGLRALDLVLSATRDQPNDCQQLPPTAKERPACAVEPQQPAEQSRDPLLYPLSYGGAGSR